MLGRPESPSARSAPGWPLGVLAKPPSRPWSPYRHARDARRFHHDGAEKSIPAVPCPPPVKAPQIACPAPPHVRGSRWSDGVFRGFGSRRFFRGTWPRRPNANSGVGQKPLMSISASGRSIPAMELPISARPAPNFLVLVLGGLQHYAWQVGGALLVAAAKQGRTRSARPSCPMDSASPLMPVHPKLQDALIGVLSALRELLPRTRSIDRHNGGRRPGRFCGLGRCPARLPPCRNAPPRSMGDHSRTSFFAPRLKTSPSRRDSGRSITADESRRWSVKSP